MIKIKQSSGNFSKTLNFMRDVGYVIKNYNLHKYGIRGVEELERFTPVNTGTTAKSWSYKIKANKDKTISINFYNSNYNDNVSIAIILQYGHATIDGGWVEGVDYINPALNPIFEKMKEDICKEVIKI